MRGRVNRNARLLIIRLTGNGLVLEEGATCTVPSVLCMNYALCRTDHRRDQQLSTADETDSTYYSFCRYYF